MTKLRTTREQFAVAARVVYSAIANESVHLTQCTTCARTDEMCEKIEALSIVARGLHAASREVAGTPIVLLVPNVVRDILIEGFTALELPRVVAVLKAATLRPHPLPELDLGDEDDATAEDPAVNYVGKPIQA